VKKMLLALLMTLTGIAAASAADTYPTKPISVVIPGPAGGAIDNVARILAEAMATKLDTNVLVLNVDGGGGTIATARVAHAKPDGYTLLFHHIGVATAPALYAKLPYDTLKDLMPIGISTEVPTVLVARTDLPATTVKDLVPYLKSQGSKILLATSGSGSVSDLCGSVLMAKIGTHFTPVAYRGSPPALIDMMGKRLDLMCDQTSTAASQIKAKGIKAYGVAASSRLPLLPDVPTLTEEGFPFTFSIWQGFYAPANTPPAVIAKLSAALQSVVQMDSVKKRLQLYGVATVDPSEATPAYHSKLLKSELVKWASFLKDTPKQ
jgi:tripartite-type tricarboxylate transporter receptor subunit TctC